MRDMPNLWVLAAKLRDIGLKSVFVEPARHSVEFLVHEELDDQHRKPQEFYRPLEDATEDLGRLNVGQLAARNFQLHSDEFLRTLKRQRRESADVIRGNGLKGLVTANGMNQLAL